MEKKAWFEEWFDTPYYHILYKNRDDDEARRFIGNLVNDLRLPAHAEVLDLACGKGRHSVTLSQFGFRVTGADLSPNSIGQAKAFSPEGIEFIVHDMREVITGKKFDAVFNLFTSFGYFDGMADNKKMLRSVHSMLREKGILVIDFMNSTRIIRDLVASEIKQIDGITFRISRKYDGSHIFKRIQFEADGRSHDHTERVQGLKLSDFISLLEESGFSILRTFGDFDLHPFNESDSDRLIIVAQRI
jgi:2-polyprenyl-3-methyl-5-hydroxy-6-metoxy-1,4-benzoquinol methylase